eukprot:1161403-Pelagomonas_calceolata.AAC.7
MRADACAACALTHTSSLPHTRICTSGDCCAACCTVHLVTAVLSSSSHWQFDAFKLNDVTNGHPLSSLAFYLFHTEGLIEHFSLKPAHLARWVSCLGGKAGDCTQSQGRASQQGGCASMARRVPAHVISRVCHVVKVGMPWWQGECAWVVCAPWISPLLTPIPVW